MRIDLRRTEVRGLYNGYMWGYEWRSYTPAVAFRNVPYFSKHLDTVHNTPYYMATHREGALGRGYLLLSTEDLNPTNED